MDNKTNTGLIVALALIALVVGSVAGAVMFPKEVIKTETKTVEVAGPTQYVDKIVYQNVTTEVPIDFKEQYFDTAFADFKYALEDEDALVCEGEEYDIDQVKVVKDYDNMGLMFKDYSEGKYSVFGQTKLKFLDTDTEEKCYATYDWSVSYRPDHDARVNWTVL